MTRPQLRNTPIDDATQRQREAGNPAANVWVMASAGTGKTTVLVERFIRLVLSGAAPERILCLTYTKAAATQMKERILRRLSSWVSMDDESLRDELESLTNKTSDEAALREGRALFGVLLDRIDRLNIMTIHAFCQSLLFRFQIEAGVPGGAEILEDSAAKAMLENVLNTIFISQETPLIERMAQYTADGSWTALLETIARERHRFQTFFDASVDTDTAINAALGVNGTEDIDTLRTEFLSDIYLPATLLESLPDKTGAKDTLSQLRGRINRSGLFDRYILTLLTKDLTLRKFKDLTDAQIQGLAQEERRIHVHLAKERAILTAQYSRDLGGFARLALAAYAAQKREQSVLDYEDLIEKAVKLLGDVDAADWVRFKLDGGIDHVLVDEAQDTSPLQWRIVAQIVQEYFAGIGKRDPENRTLFVVGDTKQSIFGFQGADPENAAAFRYYFEKHFLEAQRQWNDVPLTTSFRSAQDILDVVDACGLWEETRHEAAKPLPGRVEWHKAQTRPKNAEKEQPWSLPDKTELSAWRALIDNVADRIATILRDRIAIPSKDNAPIEPQDILVLVKKRTHLPRPLIQALRKRNIPVAGLDRFELTQDIAVQDVLSILRWALFPADDLALAEILKSPFIGWDDVRLGTLAIGRNGALWDALQEQEPSVSQWLAALRKRILAVRVDDAIRLVLEHPCPTDAVSGWRALQARLGSSCLDALTQLLQDAERQDGVNAQILTYLDRLERYAPSIKREMEGDSASGVRVMTVHGAKGLEAPIVFLIDTLEEAKEIKKCNTLQWVEAEGVLLPLWAPRKEERADALHAAMTESEQKAVAEYNRLLYVAMTRAKDGLIVMGAEPRSTSEDSWHISVQNAMRALNAREEDDSLVYGAWNMTSCTQPQATSSDSYETSPVSPTAISDRDDATESETVIWSNDRALRIGRQWHKLLERAIDSDEWKTDWPFWLEDLPDLDDEVAKTRLNALRNHVEYGFLFQPGGAAEISFITTGETTTRGRFDRLVKTNDHWWIIDYKTRLNLNDPAQRETYMAQMRGYAKALTPIAGKLAVRVALVDISKGEVTPLDLGDFNAKL